MRSCPTLGSKEFEFLQALRQFVENGNTAPDERATVGSRFNAIAAAIEEAKTQFVFHFGDRPGNCRLRNRKFSRGFRHAAAHCHDKQDMQVAEFEAAPSQLDGLHVPALSKWLWNPQTLALD